MAGLLACVEVLSCGSPQGASGSPYRIATAPSPYAYSAEARAEGQLNGQVNGDGTACLWITMNTSDMALYWPYGYSAHGHPLAVYDNEGTKVAEVGNQIIVGGARASGWTSILGCPDRFKSFWVVGQVSKQ